MLYSFFLFKVNKAKKSRIENLHVLAYMYSNFNLDCFTEIILVIIIFRVVGYALLFWLDH